MAQRLSPFFISLLFFSLLSFMMSAIAFGNDIAASFTVGNPVSAPFYSDYGYTNDWTTVSPPFGNYTVQTNATTAPGGGGDWPNVDMGHAFMTVDGATDSSMRVIYITVNPIASDLYTLSGMFEPFQIDDDHYAILSFRVDGTELDTYSENSTVDWMPFSFNYTATAGVPFTLSINDNNTNGGWNDFGLDFIQLTESAPSAVPEPSALLLLGAGLAGLAACRRFKKL